MFKSVTTTYEYEDGKLVRKTVTESTDEKPCACTTKKIEADVKKKEAPKKEIPKKEVCEKEEDLEDNVLTLAELLDFLDEIGYCRGL